MCGPALPAQPGCQLLHRVEVVSVPLDRGQAGPVDAATGGEEAGRPAGAGSGSAQPAGRQQRVTHPPAPPTILLLPSLGAVSYRKCLFGNQ